tara:strand:+ start:107 stop:457 length:351 start_codon:yes stop_codon:yes gene_type:complete
MSGKTKFVHFTDKEPSLEEVKEIVEGYIEIQDLDKRGLLVYNSHGKSEKLARNEEASDYWNNALNEMRRECLHKYENFIPGNAMRRDCFHGYFIPGNAVVIHPSAYNLGNLWKPIY